MGGEGRVFNGFVMVLQQFDESSWTPTMHGTLMLTLKLYLVQNLTAIHMQKSLLDPGIDGRGLGGRSCTSG